MFYVSNSLHISACSKKGSCAISPYQCMVECATVCRILQCVVFGNVKHEYFEGFLMLFVRNFPGVS